MTPIVKKPTILIFSPHIDDVEFGMPFFYVRALSLGFNVVEIVMTNSEYGTHEIEFKGIRLKRIRIHELKKSINLFSNCTENQTHLNLVNYIDGHLPINRKVVDQVSNLIQKGRPDIIFAPDPWYIIDHHPDHLNTGRLVYLALKKLEKRYLPKRLYYFYTFNSDTFFRVHWKDRKIIYEAYSCFPSQVSPLQRKYLKLIYWYLYYRRFFKSGFFTENFREQPIINTRMEYPKKLNLLQRFKYHFYRIMTLPKVQQFHNLTPKEIKLD
jgi:LmbE family N-acetylglucosaminyl deacetylase